VTWRESFLPNQTSVFPREVGEPWGFLSPSWKEGVLETLQNPGEGDLEALFLGVHAEASVHSKSI
jgi:hypothetical protein